MSDLGPLFAPRSVAVLGVSRQPAKLGYRLLQNVRESGYAGAVYPVNPSGEPILGYATIPDVAGLPEGIDLALVSLPAAAVPDAIRALAARRARVGVILSSGFGEVDDAGRDVQAELLAAARSAGLRLVGPNCMGVYSAPAQLNGTYFWDLPRAEAPPPLVEGSPGCRDGGGGHTAGGVSVVSQSGAYGGLIFRHLGSRGLAIARFLSIGNQVDVDIAETLDFLADDPATTLVACFVEALRDGRAFVDVAARTTARKPVVVLKGGRSDAGRRAAGSHTGSLAGTYEVYRAAFRRAGVVLAEETDEFFDAIEALHAAGDRRPERPQVAIVTVSGGPSVIAADAAERAGLEVPALSPATQAVLRGLLPSFAAVGNPIDLTPQVEPTRIGPAVDRIFAEPVIAGVIAVNVGLDIAEFADAVVDASARTGKAAVAFTADAPGITGRFRTGGVPVLTSPERAVRAWRALWAGRQHGPTGDVRGRRTATDLPNGVTGPLSYAVARRTLEACGVRFCREAIVESEEAAVNAADSIGYPVVVKADAAALTHKTEAGGVVLDVGDGAAVRAACRDLEGRTGTGRFIVQERVAPGVELLVGARRDEVFGPVVAFGTGGVFAEVFRDVSVRLAPLVNGDAEEMLGEGVRARLLAGPRGRPPVQPSTILDLLQAVSDLIVAEPRIVEIDLNPVIASGADAVAVDALMIVS
jgi:acetyltransferase